MKPFLMSFKISPKFDAIAKNVRIKNNNKCHWDTIVPSKEEPKHDLEARWFKNTSPVSKVNLMNHQQRILMPTVFDLISSKGIQTSDMGVSHHTSPCKESCIKMRNDQKFQNNTNFRLGCSEQICYRHTRHILWQEWERNLKATL